MKHNLRITFILLAMFLVTQFIGLYVVNHYASSHVVNGSVVAKSAEGLPFGLATPAVETQSDYNSLLYSIILSFVFAIFLFIFLTKFKVAFFLRLWFLAVVFIALTISFQSIASLFTLKYTLLIAAVLAIPLALVKIYGRSFFVHNFTELLIYPGIAAVFVPILNVWTVVGLLILISIYDAWAVWHSGIMQKMAKYQINHLKVFSGFFVPYVSNKVRAQIKNWKKTMSASKLAKKKIKANVAILGGGDVVFPIITSGVMLKTLGLGSALLVTLGATLGLSYLFFFAEKKKFYPAMPFITAGILLGIAVSYLVF